MVTIRSPFCGYNLAQYVELMGEDLPCCWNKVQPVTLRKYPRDRWPTDKAYFSDSGVTNISQSFTHKWRWKPAGIDIERNCVTVAVCIGLCWAHWGKSQRPSIATDQRRFIASVANNLLYAHCSGQLILPANAPAGCVTIHCHCHWTLGYLSGHSPPLPLYQKLKPCSHSVRYDTRCYFNVRSEADISQLNLPHGTKNWKWKKEKLKIKKNNNGFAQKYW